MTATHRRSFRSIIWGTTFFLLPCISSLAQEEIDSTGKESLINSRAFQFNLLGSQGISYVAPLSETSALRFMTNFKLNANTLDGTITNSALAADTGNHSGLAETAESKRASSIDLTAFYVAYLPLSPATFGFGAIGPIGRYAGTFYVHNIYRRNSADSVTHQSRSESHQNEWGVGVSGMLGIITFITPNLDIFGEMRLSNLYVWRNHNSQTKDLISNATLQRWQNEQSGWSFDVEIARLGIGIHF